MVTTCEMFSLIGNIVFKPNRRSDNSTLKPGLHVRRKHKHKHKKPTCKPVRRKHKHKRKERKLKNSDKLSAYNFVAHALPFSAMLESNLAPKGSPAA